MKPVLKTQNPYGDLKEDPKVPVISWKIQRVLFFLYTHFSEEIKLGEIANRFGYHPDYLSRKFKQELGVPFQEYLFEIRIQKAKHLLLQSEKSVKEISYDTGFCRPEFFSRVFKRMSGLSPIRYRVNFQKTNHFRRPSNPKGLRPHSWAL
ncbi:MAG TPA: AraC family transcriptional regulator [Nitrospiria bacterium]|jgi:two-component system response regulator YesN